MNSIWLDRRRDIVPKAYKEPVNNPAGPAQRRWQFEPSSPYDARSAALSPSLPGLTRQSIAHEISLMDARVEPAHDE
ncbi:MAG: hypothetical protein QHD01_30555 [Bradyrhizobium sp.]|uniref:hypothetical protein n=1 Tax=Bradyrhizobium sp. TaxID=376 RepID=UPI0029A7A15C|nr:hypothetical protein [Bradyrhizobium sp.]MDX3970910.1 hypothetical protein [Bradyrhizobium sp.]